MKKVRKEAWIIGSIALLFSINLLLMLQHTFTAPNTNETSVSESLLGAKEGIGVMYVYGPISEANRSPLFNSDGIHSIIKQLDAFEEDSRVKALIIRINSPGGTVGASQELYSEIMRFKERREIPVIISIADVGASGAYWISLAGDTVFANPGSLVGNIGVIMSHPDLSQVSERYGIDMITYKSGPFKDLGSMWRKDSKEDQRILNALIQNVHKQFVTAVKENRGLSAKQAKIVADGRIFTGEQAQEIGLVDELGSMNDAIAFAQEKVGIEGDPELILKNPYSIQQIWDFWRSQFSLLFQNPFQIESPFLTLR